MTPPYHPRFKKTLFSKFYNELFNTLPFQENMQKIAETRPNQQQSRPDLLDYWQVGMGGVESSLKCNNNINTEFNDISSLDPNSKESYVRLINIDNDLTFQNKFLSFNTDGLRNSKTSLEYDKIFAKNTIVCVSDTRLTVDKQLILQELATKYNKIVFSQVNKYSNMTGGTLICIPKQYFTVSPVEVYDQLDRFNLVAFVNQKGEKWLLGSIYLRPTYLKNENDISKHYDDLSTSIDNLLETMNWNQDEVITVLGGDFNTNLDRLCDSKKGSCSKLEKFKAEALNCLLEKHLLVDTFRHPKNLKEYRESAGFTYNPRRITFSPSRIDYFFISNILINKCKELCIETGPKSDINSDHEYLEMNIYLSNKTKSRNERRKNYRFPDYLMNNKEFMNLIENKIRDRLDKAIKFKPVNMSKKYRNTRWKIYDSLLMNGKHENINQLDLLYEIVSDILDTAILFEDWNRLERNSRERKIREKVVVLKAKANEISNIEYNIEHQRLNRQLEEVIKQKKNIKDLKLREKFQSVKDDPSPIFYKIRSDKQKKDRLVESCDILNSDGSVKETLSHPADIAAHISSIYAKVFNKESHSNMSDLENFLAQDRDKIGRITDSIKNDLEYDLNLTEMRQGIKALKLTSKGGPDGITSRLLKYLANILPQLVLGAMNKITSYEDKPEALAERYLIFIKKPNSNKTCYRKLRPINLISNLLKITSRAVSKRIENAIISSNIMTRAQFAYYKDKSPSEIVRCMKDVIADSLDNDQDSSFLFLSSDYSAAFDSVSRQYIFNVLRIMNFPESIINSIKNIYSNACCRPLINNINCLSFMVSSGVPQGCSLSGVLFNVAMIPLLAKLNCLPLNTEVKPYMLKAQRLLKENNVLSVNNIASSYADDIITTIFINLNDENQSKNIRAIQSILNTYENFSKVSSLINNDTKTVFATCFMSNNHKFLTIRDFLIENHNSVVSNFKYSEDEIKVLGHLLPLGRSEYNEGTGLLCTSLKDRFDKVGATSDRWSNSTFFPNVFSRALAAKTFLISEFQFLLANASLSEILFKRCQKRISNYVNKKSLTKKPTYYLEFKDGGTSTTNLYFLYLSTKLAWIPKIEKYECIMKQKSGYRPPAWADYVIKILHLFNTKAKYIKSASNGDLIKLGHIFVEFRLPFWKMLMDELIIVNNLVKQKNVIGDWNNHRIFGSTKNFKVCKRNLNKCVTLLDGNISIFNKSCHPFLDAGLITVGNFIDKYDKQIKYSDLIFSLYGDSIIPNSEICNEIFLLARRIKSSYKQTDNHPLEIDKLYFFLGQNTKHASNIYKLLIKRAFLKDTHPSFDNRWLTVFKYKNLYTDEKCNSLLKEYKIDALTQRCGLKTIIKNTYLPANIKNPAFEMALGAMRSETHIVKFKSHPTGEFRKCAICAELCNNTAHILLYCPIASFIWDITIDLVHIITGIKLKVDNRLKLINFTEQLRLTKANKLIINFIYNMLVIAKRAIYTFYYRGDGSLDNNDIMFEFRKNLGLTINFMNENANFLNIEADINMKQLLYRAKSLTENLIKNRPTLFSYIIKYKGENIHSYDNHGNINLRKFYSSFDNPYKNNPSYEKKNMLKLLEYDLMSLKIRNHNPSYQPYQIMKEYRRRKGILSKTKLLMLFNQDKLLLNLNNCYK